VTRWWPIPLLLCAALGFAALDRDAGLQSWWHLRAALDEADTERAVLRAEALRLRGAADRLEADGFEIERAIRERLRFARPGETLVRLPGA
jgi:cell division protein FtsB